jgi:DNA polymerase-1
MSKTLKSSSPTPCPSSGKTSASKSRSQRKPSTGQAGRTATDTQLRIDADFFAYRTCASNETELDWGEDLITIASNFQEVIRTFNSEIESLKRRFDSDNVTLYFSDTRNFRKEIDPEYKGKRTKRKPVGYKRLLQWAAEHYTVIRYPKLEADDALGLECHLDPSDFVLISPDKDMKQIACRLFNGDVEVTVTPEEADYWFWTQVITGDPVDGYKGIPGVGAVGAKKILDNAEDPWQAVLASYEKAGLSFDDAIRNARLARILRPGEYNSTTKEPILWTPPES